MRPPVEEDEEPRPEEELDVDPVEPDEPVLPVEEEDEDELPPLLEDELEPELELPDVLPPLDEEPLDPPLPPLPPPPLRLKRSEENVDESSSRGACAGWANDVSEVVSGIAIADAVASSRATPVRNRFNFILLAMGSCVCREIVEATVEIVSKNLSVRADWKIGCCIAEDRLDWAGPQIDDSGD